MVCVTKDTLFPRNTLSCIPVHSVVVYMCIIATLALSFSVLGYCNSFPSASYNTYIHAYLLKELCCRSQHGPMQIAYVPTYICTYMYIESNNTSSPSEFAHCLGILACDVRTYMLQQAFFLVETLTWL